MQEVSLQQLKHLEAGECAPSDAGLFGASIPLDDAKLVLIPVPWDATTCRRKGSAGAPDAILKASHLVELFDLDFGKPYFAGIVMLPTEKGFPYADCSDLSVVNRASLRVNDLVYRRAKKLLKTGKFVGVVGGEHSASYGLLKALAKKHKTFGVLHIGARHNLRKAYRGFQYSHASAMHNVISDFPEIKNLVSVGTRTFYESEFKFANAESNKVSTFYDLEIYEKKATGKSFASIANQIIGNLPKQVYVSLDIRGLDASLCSGSSEPVPGGLSFNEASFLINLLAKSDRKIIGFDLCEVGPQPGDGNWNAQVGAKVLYKLCGALVHSNSLLEQP